MKAPAIRRAAGKRWALAALICLQSAATAQAQLQWDGSAPTGTGGTNLGGSGTWNTANTNWWNGTIDQAWMSGIAQFGGTAGTVSVDSTTAITTTGLTFNTNNYVVTGATANDALTLNNTVLGGTGNATINVRLSGTGLTKTGTNKISLNGLNTYSGPTAINGGTLQIWHDNNLGNSAGALTLNNGTLQGSSFYLNRAITIAPGSSGTFDIARNYVSSLNSSLTGSAGTTLVKNGWGELRLLNSNAGFIGTVDVGLGILRLHQNGVTADLNFTASGGLASASSYVIRTGGTLVADQDRITGGTPAATADMISNTATITMNGGRLQFSSPANSAAAPTVITETVGNILLNERYSNIHVNRGNAAATAVLSAGTLSRSPGATVNFSGNVAPGQIATGSTRITFATAPTLNDGMIGGWALTGTGTGVDFAGYSGTGGSSDAGVGALGSTGFATYTTHDGTTLLTAVATDNVLITAAAGTFATLPTNLSINSLKLVATANTPALLQASGTTLTVDTGGILTTGNFSKTLGSTGAFLTSGSDGIYVHNEQSTLTINSTITGTGVALVKDQNGGLTLGTTVDNTYTGGTYVNGGTLTTGTTANRLYLGTGPVSVNGATLSQQRNGATSSTAGIQVTNNGQVSLANNIVYTSAGDRYNISSGSSITGASAAANQGLNSLTRVTTLAAPGDIVLAPDSIMAYITNLTAPLNLTTQAVKNLGTNADIYYGLGVAQNNAAGGVSVGVGTPFKGISTNRSSFAWQLGTITVTPGTTDIYMQGLLYADAAGNASTGATLTLGNGGTFAAPTAGAPVISASNPLNIRVVGNTTTLDDAETIFGSATAPVTMIVEQGAILIGNRHNSQGSTVDSLAKITVANGGTLQQGTTAANSPELAFNNDVRIQTGGRFVAGYVSGLTGTGTITFDPNSILQVTNATGWSGSQANATILPKGAIVRINVDNFGTADQPLLTQPSFASGDQIIELYGGSYNPVNPTNPGTTILNLNSGGMVTNDFQDRNWDGAANGVIQVLSNGAGMAATTGTTMTMSSAVDLNGHTLNIGSAGSIDGNAKLGEVRMTTIASTGGGGVLNVADGASLRMVTPNGIADTMTVNLGSGSRINVDSADTYMQLSGTGQSIMTGDSTLTLTNADNANFTLNASFKNNSSIVKSGGTGIMTLGGTDGSGAGTITLNRGGIFMAPGASLGPGFTFTVNANAADYTATFDLGNTSQTAVAVNLQGASATSKSDLLGTGGSLTLKGNLTYSAAGTPLASVVSVSNLNLDGGTRTFNVGLSATNAGAPDLTVSSLISNGAINKTGTGFLVLSNPASTFAGGLTVNTGTVRFENGADALGLGPITLFSVNLQWGPGITADFSNRLSPNFMGTPTFDIGANDVTFANPIGGSGLFGFNKNGTGTLYLKGANSFGNNNDVTINAGALKIDNISAIGQVDNDIVFAGNNTKLIIAGTTTYNDGNLQISGTNTNNVATIEVQGSSVFTFNAGNVGGPNFGVLIAGTGTPGFIKTGTGTWVLSGRNHYWDGNNIDATGLQIDQGTVVLQNVGSFGQDVLGDAGTLWPVRLNSGTLSIESSTAMNLMPAVRLMTSSTVITNVANNGDAGVTHSISTQPFYVEAGNPVLTIQGGSKVGSGTAGLTFGTTTLFGDANFNILNPAAAGAVTQFGVGAINGSSFSVNLSGNGNFIQTGSYSGFSPVALTLKPGFTGKATLSQNNSYSGSNVIGGGTLRFSTSENLGDGSATNTVSITNGTLSYTGAGPTDIGANRVISVGANSVLNAEVDSGTLTISGGITATAGVATTLTKTGLGTIVIPTPVNLAGGKVTVAEGKLQAGFTSTGLGALTVNNGGSLQLTDLTGTTLNLGGTAGALSLAGGSRLGFELNTPTTSDKIVVGAGGTAVTGGTITLDFTNLSGLAPGTYNLLQAPTGLNAANYVLGSAPPGFNYTINKSGSLVSLTTSLLVARYWTGLQNSSWATNNTGITNWSTSADGLTEAGAIPSGAHTVIFSANNTPSTVFSTTLDAAISVDSVIFSSTPSGVSNITIDPGTSGTLTLTPASLSNGLSVVANGGDILINASVTAGAAQTWSVDGTGASALTVTGNVAINNNITKAGAGTLTLSGTNTGAGGINLIGGRLNVNSVTALGSGTLALGAGTTLDNSTFGAIAMTTNNAVTLNGSFTFTGTQNLDLGTGAVTVATDTVITVTANELTFGGSVSDGVNDFALTKSGTGTLNLKGNVSTSGPFTMGDGTLILSGNNTFGGSFTHLAGTTTATGTNSVAGSFTMGNGTMTSSGSNTITGLLTVNGGTLTLDGSNTLQGGISQSGGTLNLNTANTITGTVAVNGGALNLANAGALNGATTLAFNSGSINNTSPGDLVLTTTAAQTWIGGFNYTGTQKLTFGNAPITLGTNVVTVSTTGTLVENGVIDDGVNSFSLAKSGAGTLVLNKANTYGGATILNQGTLTFGVNQNLAGGLTFGVSAGVTTGGTLDLSTNSATFAGPMLVQSNNDPGSTINIGTGQTLLVNNSFAIGNTNANSKALLGITGAGAFRVNSPGGVFQVGLGPTGAGGTTANLNMSGLTSFETNLTTGSFLVSVRGDNQSNAGNTSTVTLANTTNLINAAVVTVGASATGESNGLPVAYLRLGAGTNSIITDSFNIGTGSRDSGSVTFAESTGTVSITPQTATKVAFNMGSGGASTGYTAHNYFNSKGHNATLNFGVSAIGTQAARTGQMDNLFEFDTGTLNMDSLTVSTKGNVAAVTNSTIDIGGGVVTIGTGAGNAIVASTAGTGATATSTFEFRGGDITVKGNMTRGGGAGVSSATLNLRGASLDLSGFSIGSGTATGSYSGVFESGTLKNVAQYNGGMNQIDKTSSGTLTLSGNNAYTGGVKLSAGQLNVNSATALGATVSTLTIEEGTTLDNTSGSAVTNTNNNPQSWNGNFTYLGSNTLNLGNGPVTMSADRTITVSASNLTVGGVISGNSLNKAGAGQLTLNGTNAYTGSTTVSAGTLTVNGSIAASPMTTIVNGATLGGSGIIGPVSLNNGATLSPGNSPGTLSTGSMTWTAASNYNWQATNMSSSNPNGSNFDSLVVSGTLDIQSSFNFNLWSLSSSGPDTNGNALGFNAAANGFWKVASATTLTNGANLASAVVNLPATNGTGGFSNPTFGGSFTLVTGDTTGIVGATANDVYLKFTTNIVGGGPDLAVTGGNNANIFVLQNASLTSATTTVTLSNNNANIGAINGFTISNSNLTATINQNVPASPGTVNSTISLLSTSSNQSALGATVTFSTNPTDANIADNVATVNVRIGNAPLHPTASSTTFGTALIAATPISGTPYTNLSSNTIGQTSTGTTVPALGTTATILLYTNSTGSDTGVSMAWRSRKPSEASTSEPGGLLTNRYLVSDVVNLTGMVNSTGTKTDTFVLQMSYNEALLNGFESATTLNGTINIVSNNGVAWVNATDLNILPDTGSTVNNYINDFDGAGPNAPGSWANFVAQYGVTAANLNNFIGSWGVDQVNNQAWAVLDHNSEFAVIPEPSTLVLGGLALLGFAGVGIRRRRLAKEQRA